MTVRTFMQHALADSVPINIIRANVAAATFQCSVESTVEIVLRKSEAPVSCLLLVFNGRPVMSAGHISVPTP